MLDFLTKVNNFLEGVPMSVTKFFKAFFKSGEEFTQTYVDAVCRWVAWQVNINIERMRQRVIKTLWEQYSQYLVLMQAVQAVQAFAKDPIGSVGKIAGEFFKPVKKVIEFITVLYKEIPRLAKNLAMIAQALPPEPPNPHINFNAFQIKVHTITVNEVINGVDGMPTPEEMFPKPASPWSKAAFNASFEDAKETAAVEGVVFKLPSGQKTSGGTEDDGTAIA